MWRWAVFGVAPDPLWGCGGSSRDMVSSRRFNSRTVMSSETVAIAADHAGFVLKSPLKEELARLGRPVIDLGTVSEDSVDYPDFAAQLSEAIGKGRAKLGVLMCGTGIGMSIAANRNP